MASATRTRRDRTEKTLRPVRPNLGLEIEYRRRLEALIVEMDKSVRYWLEAAYKANEPAVAALAQDELSAAALKRVMRELSRRWLKRFDDAATKLAEYFATAVSKRSDAALKKILKDGGFSVEWKPTLAQSDIMQASVQENVALIRNLPEQYLLGVQNSVMRSVQTGRDLKQLSDDLQKHFGVTKRRAAFIARDQNNKISAALTRSRQLETGITEAVWVHSGGGKHPRPSHLKAGRDKQRYDVATGWLDPAIDKRIWPGTEINCFPGSTRIKFADDVKKAFRYWFDGELSCLVTESGETLTATPNHPILTPNGWIAIGLLNEGDYVIQISDKAIQSIPSKRDDNNAIPTISNIFDTLARGGLREISLGANFHGDVADGDIDIVFSAHSLRIGDQPDILQSVDDLPFSISNKTGFGRSAKQEFSMGASATPDGIMSLPSKFATTLWTNTVHSDLVGLTSGSDDDAPFLESAPNSRPRMPAAIPYRDGKLAFASEVGGNDIAFVNVGSTAGMGLPLRSVRDHDASGPQVFADQIGVDVDNRRDVLKGLPFGYKTLRVVNNVRRRFSDHVYTLETGSGWFSVSTEGIITKNCRCVQRPIIKGFT